ncbi:Uncharacterized protein APZ42_018398 [Daphnia magna]|uniref:Serine-rich C215.13-like protein n=2 Tax=Daphnia magna TaxID=35525 RepID=A0A0P4YSR1_9CRUS|nr:hypothetical protein OUZ56_028427 [Daphnia magna]KZS15991.1 Uncharacterized protein APZ42_018398 [Daphnia magna]
MTINHKKTLWNSYHLMLTIIVLSALLNCSEGQRISIVERLKALDKGIRQGLQRQKSDLAIPAPIPSQDGLPVKNGIYDQEANEETVTDPQQLAVNTLKPVLGPKPAEKFSQKMGEQQLSVSPEDANGTSDVVRQLTESYEEEEDDTDDLADMEVMTSKEGNLALEEGTRERKKPVAKPTKYHYYPHNQHLYLLPECATQQVCNAVYTRFNFTQPLCACADRFQGPCSASIARNDFHTIEVGMKKNAKKGTSKTGRGFKSPTLVKTCEETKLIRECRSPQDWALLALQNVRTGKSQYLVICRCEQGELDGPMSHDQPAYARVPGIRVYGMMCNSGNGTNNRNKRIQRSTGADSVAFPWEKAIEFSSTLDWE